MLWLVGLSINEAFVPEKLGGKAVCNFLEDKI